MKPILIKIIFGFCTVIFMNACHTYKHQNIFVQSINKKSNEELLNKNKTSKFTDKKSTNNSEMAPIEMPKQTETVQKLALQKQVKIQKENKFSLEKFINWNEEKLIKTQPQTIGAASQIEGVTPAAINLILIHLKKKELVSQNA